jgi:hypothetical protein
MAKLDGVRRLVPFLAAGTGAADRRKLQIAIVES